MNEEEKIINVLQESRKDLEKLNKELDKNDIKKELDEIEDRIFLNMMKDRWDDEDFKLDDELNKRKQQIRELLKEEE